MNCLKSRPILFVYIILLNMVGQSKKDEDPKAGAESADKTDVSSSNDGADKSTNEKTDSSPSSSEGATDGSRNNYFIKLNAGEARDVGFGVFGTFSDTQIGKVSFGKDEKEHEGSTAENYFLQFANNNSEGR